MTKKISIKMPEELLLLMGEIKKKKGYTNNSELIKASIRFMYEEQMLKYTNVLREKTKSKTDSLADKYSNADYCTMVLGGSIENDSCVFRESGMEISINLDNIKNYKTKEEALYA